MSETAPNPTDLEELAVTAYTVITQQQTDFFDSRSVALQHARSEGINVMELGETASSTAYTTLPRLYPLRLAHGLQTAFEALASTDSHAFLHHDRYCITVGYTKPEAVKDTNLTLLTDEEKHRCAAAIKSCRFIRRSLIPRQSGHTPSVTPNLGAIDLPLGRNVLTDHSRDGDFKDAIHDSKRDWERTLVVGVDAVHRYLSLTCDSENQPGQNLNKADRIAQHAIFISAANELIGFEEPISMVPHQVAI